MRILMGLVLTLAACSVAAAADIRPAIAEFDALHFDKARQLFTPLVNDEKYKKQASYYLGRIAIANVKFEDAKDFLEESVKIQPNNVDELYWLGNAYYSLTQRASMLAAGGLISSFRKNTEAALAIDPNHLPSLLSLYQFYAVAPAFVGGSPEKAEQLLTRIDALSKPYADIARLTQLTAKKETDKAVALAQTMATTHVQSDEALFEAGKTLSANGKYPEALAALDKATAVKLTADNYRRVQGAYFEIGQACWRKHDDLDRGIAALNKATDARQFPVNGYTNWSYFRLAQLYQMKGDTAQQKKYMELLDKTGVDKDGLLAKAIASQAAAQ